MSRILIPNRGEIALRVIRACRELGHEAIIAHSRADEATRPVRVADNAICIGEAASAGSYLDQDSILTAAEICGADAIHPGYGMLSENAEFARKVKENGYTFIGPSGDIMALMGQKAEARRQLKEAGMPVLPGSDGKLKTLEKARKVAEKVEYPLMIKAAAGGGGRGIARVDSDKELEEQFPRVQAEAEAAFDSPWMYIEKFIPDPRHIEFQVMGDGKGNVLHFYERECSIQRRHQKLLEEAPSPALTRENRDRIATTVCDALGELNYNNAGTVEFVMDDDENAYVIEVNTRIQVEHPVSEMICGVDLIAIQIQTALEGELPLSQSDIDFEGHAMEVRVCAEDPVTGFTPQQGTIEHLNFPDGPGTRVDSHLEVGTWISPYYDSMIGKIICWHSDREKCIDRMLRCLDENEIRGVKTTIPLFQWLLEEENFRAGDFHTGFLDNTDWQDQLREKS